MHENNSPPFPYFIFPNAFVDHFLAALSGPEVNCYLAIMRKTHGWHKATDSISNSQIMALTGHSEKTVRAALQSLVEKEIIYAEQNAGRPTTFEVNGPLMDSLGRRPLPQRTTPTPPQKGRDTPPPKDHPQNTSSKPIVNQQRVAPNKFDAPARAPLKCRSCKTTESGSYVTLYDKTGQETTDVLCGPCWESQLASLRQPPAKRTKGKSTEPPERTAARRECIDLINTAYAEWSKGRGKIIWDGKNIGILNRLLKHGATPADITLRLDALKIMQTTGRAGNREFWEGLPPTPATLSANWEKLLPNPGESDDDFITRLVNKTFDDMDKAK